MDGAKVCRRDPDPRHTVARGVGGRAGCLEAGRQRPVERSVLNIRVVVKAKKGEKPFRRKGQVSAAMRRQRRVSRS